MKNDKTMDSLLPKILKIVISVLLIGVGAMAIYFASSKLQGHRLQDYNQATSSSIVINIIIGVFCFLAAIANLVSLKKVKWDRIPLVLFILVYDLLLSVYYIIICSKDNAWYQLVLCISYLVSLAVLLIGMALVEKARGKGKTLETVSATLNILIAFSHLSFVIIEVLSYLKWGVSDITGFIYYFLVIVLMVAIALSFSLSGGQITEAPAPTTRQNEEEVSLNEYRKVELLKLYKGLLDQGAITEEEYQKKKEDLLK